MAIWMVPVSVVAGDGVLNDGEMRDAPAGGRGIEVVVHVSVRVSLREGDGALDGDHAGFFRRIIGQRRRGKRRGERESGGHCDRSD